MHGSGSHFIVLGMGLHGIYMLSRSLQCVQPGKPGFTNVRLSRYAMQCSRYLYAMCTENERMIVLLNSV